MKMFCRASLLALLLCSTLSPAAVAAGPQGKRHHKNVPEGGSALAYLSFSALACIGAVVVRSRREQAKLPS